MTGSNGIILLSFGPLVSFYRRVGNSIGTWASFYPLTVVRDQRPTDRSFLKFSHSNIGKEGDALSPPQMSPVSFAKRKYGLMMFSFSEPTVIPELWIPQQWPTNIASWQEKSGGHFPPFPSPYGDRSRSACIWITQECAAVYNTLQMTQLSSLFRALLPCEDSYQSLEARNDLNKRKIHSNYQSKN